VVTALRNKKAVYCEKPLALNLEELKEIEQQIMLPDSPLLTVGFNRRFAPMALQLFDFFQGHTEPMSVHYRVNAGFLPLTHWLHDPQQGGGRIVGEGCHFIDFLTYLIGVSPISVTAAALDDIGKYKQDNVVLIYKYRDGSIGTLTYLSNGNKNFAKENVEVFCGGKIAMLNDFRTLEMVTETKRKILRSRFKQDKGHASAWAGFINAVERGGPAPIPYEQLIGTAKASFAAVEALRTGKETAI
jgi:predicted dehydrogenase